MCILVIVKRQLTHTTAVVLAGDSSTLVVVLPLVLVALPLGMSLLLLVLFVCVVYVSY